MTFLSPQFLYLVPLAAIAGVLVLWSLWARRRGARRFYGDATGRPWAPMPGAMRAVAGAVLWTLSLACLAVALARPAHSPEARKVQRTGRDAVFVIDVSRSMLAQDLRPNRLERAKLMVGDVLDSAEGDRVGIVAFAGTAVQRCPMTTDYAFARMSLEALSPDSVGRGGTAIGDAVRAALALLLPREGEPERRLDADIYLLSDGEDHETAPLEAAAEAAEHGARLICIGLGSDVGAPVPIDAEQSGRAGRGGYVEYGGERVQSRLDAGTLRSMAEATPGGVFLDVGVGNLELDRVYRLLRREGQQRQMETTESVRYTEAFQFPLGASLVLAVLAAGVEGVYVSARRPRRTGIAVAAGVAALVLLAPAARAQSLADDLRDSQEMIAEGKAGEAMSLLEGAVRRHGENEEISFRRGLAQLALNQPENAEASFRAAERDAIGRDEGLAARARYNLGLIEAQRAAVQAEKDPGAAMESLARAERWFRNARTGLTGTEREAAAGHVETLQRAREALRREIAEQKKQQQGQDSQQQQNSQSQSGSGQGGEGKSGNGGQQGEQNPQQEQQGKQEASPEQKSADELADLARRQDEAAKQAGEAAGKQQSEQEKRAEAERLGEEQRKLSEQTSKVEEQLEKQQQEAREREAQQGQEAGKDSQSENFARSRDKLDEARRSQARAEEQLRQGDSKSASETQRQAAEQLRDAARAALGIDKQQGEKGEEGEQEAAEAQQQAKESRRAFNATAANILDREAKTREAIRRFLKAQQRARAVPVEKDW